MFKITDRRQQQELCNAMNGHPLTLHPDQLDEDYFYLYRVIEQGRNSQQSYQQLIRVKQAEPELAQKIDNILSLEPGQRNNYESLAQIGPDLPEVVWFWPDWIPRGMLTLLAASPGVGKTNVALDIARRAIHGLDGPDGQPLNTLTGNIIYVDAENFLPVIYRRASAWRMDLARFFPLRPPMGQMIDLAAAEYQDQLKDMCYELEPDLVVIDSLSSVNMRGENNIEDLRGVLSFMIDLSEAFGLALVVIHHLRKPGKSQTGVTMHDLRGSGHLTAMARSILGLYVQSDDPNGPRRLKILKTNLTRHPRPLSIHYVESVGDPEVAMLDYGYVDLPDPDQDTLTGQCADWLTQLLQAAGPDGLSYAEITEQAQHNDPAYSQSTVQRARAALDWQIEDTLGPRITGNCWRWYEEKNNGHADMLHVHHPPFIFYPPPVGHAACVHVRHQKSIEWQLDRSFLPV